MSERKRIEAVTFDAYGTVLVLDRPFETLQAVLAEVGVSVPLPAAEAAFRAEMAHYRVHHVEARDAKSLTDLHARCAGILFDVLADRGCACRFSTPEKVRLLLKSVHFRLYDDVAAALAFCRRAGLRMGMITNWDYAFRDEMERAGLDDAQFEAIAVSGVLGVAKPDPAIFEHSLRALRARPDQVLHIGDEWENDIAAARAVGMHAALLDRGDSERGRDGWRMQSLSELPAAFADRAASLAGRPAA